MTLAIEFSERLLRDFKDPEGGFYFTADEHEQLIARNKDLADSSVPSGNAMAATGLLTLSRLTGRNEFRNAAEDALIAASGVMASSPQAAGQALRALLQFLNVSQELVLFTGQDNFLHLKRAVLNRLNPFSSTLIVSGVPDQQLLALCPWLENRGPIEDQATLFVCSDSVCQQPMSGPRITEFLEAAALS